MTNPVHLIVTPKEGSNLSRAIGESHRRYTRYINFREGWRGYLWQGRFSSFPMEESYLIAAAAYVELNPVRANMVSEAWDYRWSSVHAHIAGKSDDIIEVEPLGPRKRLKYQPCLSMASSSVLHQGLRSLLCAPWCALNTKPYPAQFWYFNLFLVP